MTPKRVGFYSTALGKFENGNGYMEPDLAISRGSYSNYGVYVAITGLCGVPGRWGEHFQRSIKMSPPEPLKGWSH